MKTIFVSIATFFLCGVMLQAQTDTMYVMKAGVVINKQSIKLADVDSIVFYNPDLRSAITINNSKANMVINESRAFVAIIDNAITNKTVIWSVEPTNTGGTINADPNHNNVGIYKAPAVAGVYKIYAKLVSDPKQTASVEITVSDIAIDDEQIFYNGNVYGVQNGPTNPTVFTIDRERLITTVINYHYFNGGAFPGKISLRHSDGEIYGPWQTSGTVGQGGVTNAYWNCYPLVKIKAGTYTVIDSDPSTWSHNSSSNKAGFTWIRAMK
jgi:hypothetical protein